MQLLKRMSTSVENVVVIEIIGGIITGAESLLHERNNNPLLILIRNSLKNLSISKSPKSYINIAFSIT